jgi:signal transduction histidine kinase
MTALILIIDDSPDVLMMVTALLRHRGYEAMTASSGAEAVALMEERRPDLIICDIVMPEMDGFEVFRRVRAERRWRLIPIVFLTALDDAPTRLRSNELGAESFITKPFRSQDLLAAVAGLLHRAHELQAYSEAEMENFKAQLLFMFTHELSTPLSVLRMLTNNLRANLPRLSQTQIAANLELLARSTDDLAYIVDTLLLAIQIDSGRAKTLFASWAAPLRVRTVLDAAIAQVQLPASERQVQLVVRGGEDEMIFGYEPQVRQIFRRILDNAVRFSPKGAQVSIRVERSGQLARITFADHGPGMTPDEITQAFGRMQQINRAEQQQQGIGMSLNLVKALVEIHGGEISIESTPGHGASITVTLPHALRALKASP